MVVETNMTANRLVHRYASNRHGVLSCFDRIIIVDTLPGACYTQGMTSFLYQQDIRIFDYPKFAEPLRDRIRKSSHDLSRLNLLVNKRTATKSKPLKSTAPFLSPKICSV